LKDISKNILGLAASGNTEAFEKIYRAASTFVYTIALRITNNRDDAEDVTQEVFIKVYKNLGKFRFHSSFKTWIYRIAVNTAINTCREKAKEMGRSNEEIEDITDMNQYPAQEIETAYDNKDNEKHISSLLKILNPDQRACIVLREIEGLNYKEIAEVLKVKINTVRSRLKRAREALLAHRKGKVMENGM